MSNTKKYESIIREIHEAWAVKNGYREKPQATSTHPDLLPKHGPEYYAPRRKRRAAHPNDLLDSKNSEHFVESAKPQATSVKRQASS